VALAFNLYQVIVEEVWNSVVWEWDHESQCWEYL
jgi:hypothetical protein